MERSWGYADFGKAHRVRAVEILGSLQPWQDAAGEAHHLSPHVNDGKHKAGAELVVDISILSCHSQAGIDEVLFGKALGHQGLGQRIPLPGSCSQAEVDHKLGRDLSLDDIVPDGPALWPLQIIVVELDSGLVGGQGGL